MRTSSFPLKSLSPQNGGFLRAIVARPNLLGQGFKSSLLEEQLGGNMMKRRDMICDGVRHLYILFL